MARIAVIAGTVFLIGSGASVFAAAPEVAYVYLDPPEIQFYIDRAEQLRREMLAAKARWAVASMKSVRYTIVILPNGEVSVAGCDRVPINVWIKQDRVIKESYAMSTRTCHSASPVKRPGDAVLTTPEGLFHEIEAEIERTASGQPQCFDAMFDGDSGLPILLQYGCPWIMDSDWRIQVKSVKVSR